MRKCHCQNSNASNDPNHKLLKKKEKPPPNAKVVSEKPLKRGKLIFPVNEYFNQNVVSLLITLSGEKTQFEKWSTFYLMVTFYANNYFWDF